MMTIWTNVVLLASILFFAFFVISVDAYVATSFSSAAGRASVRLSLSHGEESSTIESQNSTLNDSSRRRFLQKVVRNGVLVPIATLATIRQIPTTAIQPEPALAASDGAAGALIGGGGSILDTPEFTKPANPFVQLETVGMIPKAYFEENRSIYAFTERILDGDTIRVRHVPGFSFTNSVPEPIQKRGIAEDTLLIRLYGVDCPEIAKNKKQITQPFGDTAKQFTSDMVYHEMVKVTFLRRDRYGRAIAMVETLPSAGWLLSGIPGLGPKDLSIELAKEGLAELYTGGGAEYYTKKVELLEAIVTAKKQKRGVWSLGEDRVSAAEQKRILRGEGQDPAAVVQLAN